MEDMNIIKTVVQVADIERYFGTGSDLRMQFGSRRIEKLDFIGRMVRDFSTLFFRRDHFDVELLRCRIGVGGKQWAEQTDIDRCFQSDYTTRIGDIHPQGIHAGGGNAQGYAAVAVAPDPLIAAGKHRPVIVGGGGYGVYIEVVDGVHSHLIGTLDKRRAGKGFTDPYLLADLDSPTTAANRKGKYTLS